MNAIQIDKAGRLVLPKALRDELRLRPGDMLEIQNEGDRIILSPLHAAPALQKEQGVWVYRAGESTSTSLADLVEEDRQNRSRDVLP